MKKFTIIFGFIVILFSFSSCVTMNQVEFGKKFASHSPIEFENEDVKSTLTFNNAEWVGLVIESKSESVLQFITDLSTFTASSGNSSKLVPEGTKYIDAKNSVPPSAIPPRSRFQKSFFSADSIYYSSGQYGGWRSQAWIPNSLAGTTFVFTYKINGIDKYIIFSGDKSQSSLPVQSASLGTVTVKETYWNFLFLNSVENRRKVLFDKAMLEAKNKYGENIELKNLRYQGDWNAASLLFYFSMLGFVEDATLTADVFAK